MRFAYADPPYLGCGTKHYADHPDAADWDTPDAHKRLIAKLCDEYPDGWALSCSSPSLKTLGHLRQHRGVVRGVLACGEDGQGVPVGRRAVRRGHAVTRYDADDYDDPDPHMRCWSNCPDDCPNCPGCDCCNCQTDHSEEDADE